jgi:uncharacterized protein
VTVLGRLGDAVRWLVWGAKVLMRGTWQLGSLAGRGLGDALEPWKRVASAAEIPFEELVRDGKRAVLFDLENTLIPPGGPFTEHGRVVVAKARAAGLAVGVVSNASASWVRHELEREGIPYVAPAGKPGRAAFERGCALVGTALPESVYVGDQVITDVLGAQRAGLLAILVDQLQPQENLSARFQRLVTRILLRVTRR